MISAYKLHNKMHRSHIEFNSPKLYIRKKHDKVEKFLCDAKCSLGLQTKFMFTLM